MNRILPGSGDVAKIVFNPIAKALDWFSGATVDLTQFYDRVLCINLKRRPERWSEFQKEVDRADWPFRKPERFDAVDGSKETVPKWWRVGEGAWGCYQSHMRIWKDAIADGIKSVLIFEDDAVFCNEFAKRCQTFIQHVPVEWDCIYLGGMHLPFRKAGRRIHSRDYAVPLNPEVLIPYDINLTHAHSYTSGHIPRVIAHMESLDAQRRGNHVDHRLGKMHRTGQYNIFVPTHWLVGQRAGKSDVQYGWKKWNFDRR